MHNNILKILFFLIFTFSYSQENWTLQQCVDYAIKNNIQIKNAALDYENAEISKKAAKSAFLPNVNASANHSWNIGLNQNITTGLLENQTTQFTSAGFNVGVDIFRGLQLQNQLRKSNLGIIASQYQLTKMQEDTALNVANAYLQILFNKENAKVLETQQLLNVSQLQRTQELVNAGSVPRGDLLDIEATVALDNQRLIAAQNVLLISKLSLAQLLQIEDYENFDIATEDFDAIMSTVLQEKPEEVVKKAKESRTEIKLAQTQLSISEKDIQIAKSAYYPSITGFYSFNTRAAYTDRVSGYQLDATNPSIIGYVEGTNQNVLQPNFRPIITGAKPIFDQFSENKGQNFGLSVNVPIFNGFSARYNVERSIVAYEKSKLSLQQQTIDLERNVYTAYTDTKAAKESFEAAKKTLDARKLSFEYAKQRYDVGLMNIFDLNQAQTLYANAQSEVLRTKYDFIFRTKILEFYFGIPLIKKQ